MTGNKEKVREARSILSRFGISVRQVNLPILEVQSDLVEEVAKHAALSAYTKLSRPLIVEDAGLFIEGLNQFPGPYSSFVYETIGNEGVLKLMRNVRNRRAVFKSAVAYASSRNKVRLFVGEARGCVLTRKKGSRWGFDPIFASDTSQGRSFAEIGPRQKNLISHRAKAFTKFGSWFTNRI